MAMQSINARAMMFALQNQYIMWYVWYVVGFPSMGQMKIAKIRKGTKMIIC